MTTYTKVTDAMVEAAHSAYWDGDDTDGNDRPHMRRAIEAALAASPSAQAVDLEKFRKLEANWRRIADTHGVRQFSGNDHLLFANELLTLIDQQDGKGVSR